MNNIITIPNTAIDDEAVMNKIIMILGKKVMVDRDLAVSYGITTKRLNEQVKRNTKRFPEDFMFQLSVKEEVVANCDHLKKIKFSSSHHLFLQSMEQ